MKVLPLQMRLVRSLVSYFSGISFKGCVGGLVDSDCIGRDPLQTTYTQKHRERKKESESEERRCKELSSNDIKNIYWILHTC